MSKYLTTRLRDYFFIILIGIIISLIAISKSFSEENVFTIDNVKVEGKTNINFSREKYINKAFVDSFEVNDKDVEKLEYQSIDNWDSIGHMSLMSNLESEFSITLDTDDIIDFSSHKKGKEILKRYKINI